MYTTCSGEAVRGGGVRGAGEHDGGIAARAALDRLRTPRLGQSPTPRCTPVTMGALCDDCSLSTCSMWERA